MESLNALCSGLAEDSLARGFFDDLKKIALEYAVVMDTGSLISGLSFRKENISYDSLDGAKMILIGNVLTEEGESEVEPGGPIRLTEEEGRGLSVVRKPISQIRGLDADRVLATGEVCDIYFHEYDITGKMRKADGM